MTLVVDDELAAIIGRIARNLFGQLKAVALESWQHAMCTQSKQRGHDQLSQTFSVLHHPNSDAVEIELEVREVDDKVWAEATLYLGQETAATLSASLWPHERPSEEDLAVTFSSFVTLLTPLFLQALSITENRRT